jgi:hypothetical protein
VRESPQLDSAYTNERLVRYCNSVLDVRLARKGCSEGDTAESGSCKNVKKEEFPGFMENMLPGNSFPQICVVSVNKSVEKLEIAQEYGWTPA